MKLLKALTLSLCSSLFSLCLIVILAYSLVSMTILSPMTVKGWLHDSGTYDQLLDTVITPQLNKTVEDQASQQLVTGAMVSQAAHQSVTPNFIQTSTETVVDATYAWLNAAKPTISYKIPIKPVTDSFFASLRTQLITKLQALPRCRSYAVSAEALSSGTCLPQYVTPSDAADQVIANLRASGPLQSDVLTEQSFTSTATLPPAVQHLPDYLGYAWLANLIAWPFALLLGLIIVWNRRASGLIAVGTAIVIPGLLMMLAAIFGTTLKASSLLPGGSDAQASAMLNSIVATALPAIARMALVLGAVTLGVGLCFMGLGIFWKYHRRGAPPTQKIVL